MILGICLWAQLLLDKSEEGAGAGLFLIPGEVLRFEASELMKGERIPHRGWSEVDINDEAEALQEIEHPMYDEDVLKEGFQFVMKKLGFSEQEFYAYIDSPEVPHSDFGLSRSRWKDFRFIRWGALMGWRWLSSFELHT